MTEASNRVMVITAHPDDPEFAAAGTIAKMVKEGREVTYVIVTTGSKGTGDRSMTPERLARIREEEQRNAARVLGVERLEFLGYEDGELEDTHQLRLDITRQIRRWRPHLIITQHPTRAFYFYGWHRDHRVTAGAVLDCVYPLARDHLSFPELLPEYEPHIVREVYMTQWQKPELIVDITATMDLKLTSLACHVSQASDVNTIEARVRKRAATMGEAKGYAYGEGFDRVVIPG